MSPHVQLLALSLTPVFSQSDAKTWPEHDYYRRSNIWLRPAVASLRPRSLSEPLHSSPSARFSSFSKGSRRRRPRFSQTACLCDGEARPDTLAAPALHSNVVVFKLRVQRFDCNLLLVIFSDQYKQSPHPRVTFSKT